MNKDHLELCETKTDFLKEVTGTKISSDPDNAQVSREFYANYWKFLSDDIETYSAQIGGYRGETIISFRTMATVLLRTSKYYKGNNIPDKGDKSKKRLDLIQEWDDIPQGLKKKFEEFYKKYHSLANFMPLPNEKWHCKKNLNEIKGIEPKYRDFPDAFYRVIRENVYTNHGNLEDNSFLNSEYNKKYFDKFSSWKEYVEKNYLQDLFLDEEYTKFIKLKPTNEKTPYKDHKNKLSNNDISDIRNEVKEFLDNALAFIDKRAERLSKVQFNNELKALKRSPLFALSLGGKEISHSNFWAWLIEIEMGSRHPFIDVFIPGFNENNYEFEEVTREEKHIDLLIRYRVNKELRYFLVENKLKAVPNTEQLEKYSEIVKNDKKQKGFRGLLTGVKETLNLTELEEWSFCSYEEIAKRIESIFIEFEYDIDPEYSSIIKFYIRDIRAINRIIECKLNENDNKYIYKEKELSLVKLDDLFLKLKASEFAKFINERIESNKNLKLINNDKWKLSKAEVGFSNKTPIITIIYQELNKSNEEYGRLGVQIQGKQFRIYGGGSELGINSIEKVKKILVDKKYLYNNFKEKYGDKRRISMRDKPGYCKYLGKDYCHLYQHWDIDDFNYESLTKEIEEQLQKAKNIIEKGISFKKR